MTQLDVYLMSHLGHRDAQKLHPGLNLKAVLPKSLTFTAFPTLPRIRPVDKLSLFNSGFDLDTDSSI